MQSELCFFVSFSLALLAFLGAGNPVGAPRPRLCNLGHYRSLDRQSLEAVKALKDLYELEMLSWERRDCLFSRTRQPRKVSPCTRLHLLAVSLANAESVLRNLTRPDLAAKANPVLELLSAIRRDVDACLVLPTRGSLPESSTNSGTPGQDHSERRTDRPRKLSRLAETSLKYQPSEAHPTTQPWIRRPEKVSPGEGKWAQSPDFHPPISPIHSKQERMNKNTKTRRKHPLEGKLHKAKRMENLKCREAEIILNLLTLLNFDLKLAVLSGSCP